MAVLLCKKLVASELILFRSLFLIRDQLGLSMNTKQKAISPPAELLLNIYGNLPDTWSGRVDLRIYGPGMRGPLPFPDRSLKKQDKNWRIEGDIDDTPYGSPYIQLRADDYAVMLFHGEGVPKAIDIFLLSASDQNDVGLLDAVRSVHQKSRNIGRSRTAFAGCLCEPADIVAAADIARIPDQHPLLSMLVWADDVTIEENAAQGSAIAIEIRRRAGRTPLTPEKFQELISLREKIGRQGEELVYKYLASTVGLPNFHWVSRQYPDMPYDFEVRSSVGEFRVEVKSTMGSFRNQMRFSVNELECAREPKIGYLIMRVYNLNASPLLRATPAINNDAIDILNNLRAPSFVTIGDLWIDPERFPFQDDVYLAGL